ncbi:MAG: hypothetical protein KDJ26_02675 [Alphaproteobacteria bacterium]|nr:hypothetical protein [Alphaproteobacteria bacterium]HPQ50766.1 hypothetical protein [Alphaproteobacteria bacterium]HRK98766.1 hypothetical protein [Alphaproteobacteria bacterium]
MPRNGYWIECIPVELATNTPIVFSNEKNRNTEQCHLDDKGQYRAIFSSIPDLDVVAPSPDQAIDKLRHKLRALSRYYRMTGRTLPESDNPVRPPKNLRTVQGWISVYVHLTTEPLIL